MKKIKYYDIPKQVFFRTEGDDFTTGIAYKNEIICLCCGGITPIDDEVLEEVIEVKNWHNINNAIEIE